MMRLFAGIVTQHCAARAVWFFRHALLGSVDVSFASANGVKKPPIEARDDGHTGVWPRSATKSGGFLTPFPSGCPQEGPSTLLQSLTGDYPSFVLRLLADPSWGQRTGKAYVNRA